MLASQAVAVLVAGGAANVVSFGHASTATGKCPGRAPRTTCNATACAVYAGARVCSGCVMCMHPVHGVMC
jgi:hypothetical protein